MLSRTTSWCWWVAGLRCGADVLKALAVGLRHVLEVLRADLAPTKEENGFGAFAHSGISAEHAKTAHGSRGKREMSQR